MRIAVVVVLAGCVGGIDSSGGGTPTTVDSSPLGTFESSVAPILARCDGCHTSASNAPNFADSVAATEYQKVTSQPTVIGDFSASGTPLLTTIVAGGHNGMTYSSAEVATITAWLTKEVAARMPTTTTTTTTTNPSEPQIIAALEDQWSGCLTLGDFTSANMADAWGNMMAEDPQEACETCHVTGGNNFIASDNGPQFFQYISTKRNYMLQYFAVDVDHGPAKMIVNWTSFASVNGGGINNAHPLFPLNNDGMTALTAFYDLVASRLAQGACGPKTLTD